MIVISQTFSFVLNEYFTPGWEKKNVLDVTRRETWLTVLKKEIPGAQIKYGG